MYLFGLELESSVEATRPLFNSTSYLDEYKSNFTSGR